MIRNYFRVALRTILRKPFYFFINLTGLAVGIASCTIILLYVAFELRYDRFHTKHDRIYRVNYDVTMGANRTVSPSVPVFVAPHLKRMFPEIEQTTRFLPAYSSRTVRSGEMLFDEPGFAWADSSFFSVLDFKAVYGDLSSALTKPGAVVLTSSVARKYFGGRNPVGETLLVNNSKEHEVTAVIEDVPATSYFTFDFLASLHSLDGLTDDIVWNNPNYVTFVLVRPDASVPALSSKIDRWVNPEGPSQGNSIALVLELLSQVHFNTGVFNFRNTFAVTDFRYVVLFSIVAIIILSIACINYVNLATARAANRAKEVGMRKTVGADRRQLIFQFMTESFLMVLPAIIIAMGLVKLLLPSIQMLFGKPLTLDVFSLEALSALLVVWIVLSLLAGFYPAIVLSRFKPAKVLKGSALPEGAGISLRKMLVVVQFSISTIMVICTIIIVAQLRFIQDQKLGLDKDQVLMLRGNAEVAANLESMVGRIRELPGVEDASPTWRSPFETVVGNGFSLTTTPSKSEDWKVLGAMAGNERYIPTVGLKLVAGRNFDPAKVTQDTVINEFIVNETFLRDFGLSPEEAIGKQIVLGLVMNNGPGTIVGVVEDFNVASLHNRIEPVMLFNHPDYCSSVLVRVSKGADVTSVLSSLEKEWKSVSPQRPFNFTFLDDQYDALYRTEQRVSLLVSVFSGLAIFVACLGLLGLASYSAMQRSKEIGIRKVLGASTANILALLSGGYLRLMAVAFLVAVPVSYFAAQEWLSTFAYRIDIEPTHFLIAVILVSAVAIGTVALQSVKAALLNPAHTLKVE